LLLSALLIKRAIREALLNQPDITWGGTKFKESKGDRRNKKMYLGREAG